MFTNDFEILKYCKTFFSKLYNGTQTNPQIQEKPLNSMKSKINIEENEKLI